MRKVRLFKMQLSQDMQETEFIPQETAYFHQWGIDYEELRDGVGHFSTAIVELEDGTVKNYPACLIQFVNETN